MDVIPKFKFSSLFLKQKKKRKKEENAAYDLKTSGGRKDDKKKDDVEVEGQGLMLFEDEEYVFVRTRAPKFYLFIIWQSNWRN